MPYPLLTPTQLHTLALEAARAARYADLLQLPELPF